MPLALLPVLGCRPGAFLSGARIPMGIAQQLITKAHSGNFFDRKIERGQTPNLRRPTVPAHNCHHPLCNVAQMS